MELEAAQLVPEMDILSKLLEEMPEKFVSGSQEICDAALVATKFVFDQALQSEPVSRPHILNLLSSLTPSEAPQTRSQTRAGQGKRKRSASPPPEWTLEDTPLTSLFIDGMNDEQIWGQLDLRGKNVCSILEGALGESEQDDGDMDSDDAETRRMLKVLQSLEMNGINLDDLEDDDDTTLDEEGLLDQNSGDDTEGDDDDDDSDESEDDGDYGDEEKEPDDDVDLGEGITSLHNSSSSSDSDIEGRSFSEDGETLSSGSKHNNRSSLDDNFFDLASFNAESEAAEASYVSRGSLSQDLDGGSSEEDEDTFVDMFAPVNNFDHFDEEDLEQNDGEAYYKDFFDPPPRNDRNRQVGISPGKVRFHEEVRVKKINANKGKQPVSTINLLQEPDGSQTADLGRNGFGNSRPTQNNHDLNDEDDESIKDDASISDDSAMRGQETIARLKDDLFADDGEEPEAENLSTHEKRMAALRQEIVRLEAENVGKKDWVLMGEASSRSRPQNSLLEEDLEFDRVMKAIPVITEQSVQALEERIKARISEQRFDDVVRRRPVDDKPFLPSRLFELKDTKSTQSLAQIYEADYVAAQTGGAVVDDRDGRLKKEHEELEKVWEDICWKLDALCNAQFVPKQPKATISTVSNAPAVTLESALPTAKSLSTILAPEEIFTADPSDSRARSEMTPSEKRALRNKERKSRKRTRDLLNKNVDKYAKMKGIRGVKKQKEEALKSVVKSGKGVTVLGKKDGLAKKERNRRPSR